MQNIAINVGELVKDVTLETHRDPQISRPRVRPLDHFPNTMRVEFPRKLRELFPIGTQYRATVKVCQKHSANGDPHAVPYLKAMEFKLIAESIPDKGMIAKLRSGCLSGRSYDYFFEDTF